MNYMDFVSALHHRACVIAIRLQADRKKAQISIEAANDAYLESVGKKDEKFVPGLPYTNYIQYDPNFETMCVRCATANRSIHQYVNAGLYNAWLDLYMLPLVSEDEDVLYCLFSYEMNTNPDSEKLLDISANTAIQALKTSLKLRETDDFQAAMDSIIKDIRKLCDSSACSILLTDFEAHKCSILCVDHDDSFSDTDDDIVFMEEFYEVAETWRDLMAGSNCYIVADENDMKKVEEKDPKWAASLKISGIRNVVLYPLRLNNKILGYIWATNFNVKKIRTIKDVMEINAFLLSAEIGNHQMFEKMEMMSRHDMLTGLLNRNAMNNRIEEWKNGDGTEESITENTGLTNKGLINTGLDNTGSNNNGYGVVFVDVNGLKRVNDNYGHTAGDELIISVANILKEIFTDCEIYRAGGDEFMIIADNCPRERFEQMVSKIREKEREAEAAQFAVGAFYDDLGHDIRKALKAADSEMYKDKAGFYKEHPELSRRS